MVENFLILPHSFENEWSFVENNSGVGILVAAICPQIHSFDQPEEAKAGFEAQVWYFGLLSVAYLECALIGVAISTLDPKSNLVMRNSLTAMAIQ